MRNHRRIAAASALLLGLALSACATPSGAPPSGAPPAPATADAEVDAAWLDAGRLIAVVTYGSSSCVPIAGETSADGQTITVELQESAEPVCTADLAPRATLVTPPATVDSSQEVTIVVTGAAEGTAELDGGQFDSKIGEPTDYAPSAGWYDDDGFVVLTWGSSSCVPEIADITDVTDNALHLAFADFPADQMCTMDMGPRLAMAIAPAGFEADGDVTLVLTGANIDATTTILGEP